MITERPRITGLDALRGTAALSVVLGHITGGLFNRNVIEATPLNILISGHKAVLFFFLLSGFVLVYQYDDHPQYTYRRFLIQRFFRLYIPYLAAMLLSWLLFLLFAPTQAGPAWLGTVWNKPVSISLLLQHVLLVGNFNTDLLNAVIWSLVHEMRISILFPLVLFIVRLKPAKALALIAIITATAMVLAAYHINASAGYNNSYVMTMYYLYIFVFGGLIAKYRLALISKYHMVISRQKGLLLFAAVLIYNYANFIPLSLTKYNTQLADFLTVAASCYFILTAIAVTDSKTLFANRAMLFLGRISYSLYLVHLPVWIFFRNQFYGKMPVALLALLGLLVCFFAAVIFNRWVEGPTIKLIKSKRLKLALTDK